LNEQNINRRNSINALIDFEEKNKNYNKINNRVSISFDKNEGFDQTDVDNFLANFGGTPKHNMINNSNINKNNYKNSKVFSNTTKPTRFKKTTKNKVNMLGMSKIGAKIVCDYKSDKDNNLFLDKKIHKQDSSLNWMKVDKSMY